ncbi:MAG TPA: vitamin B12-dependent ribonucleotide reductase [Actinomycetota bacterium]|nr:vitamin B12-dependent ribonucleotide reductase [Actinomycetota bacterium]
MSDGVHTAGLRMERYFTQPGLHPYAEVEWERRDARIGSGDKIAFEQRDLEFPKAWSQNATNIVAQKYFRGPLGSPRREGSVKSMIDRVVGWYTERGIGDRYFSDGSEETFAAELTHLLLMQKMAFNSPVWFNVGLVNPPRVSACFILDVEDDMQSILNWYVEEGLIFKAGSGAGINLSKLRSSKELLTSGGTASGPVSFMRGADASAGTIKSGGSTRRAAKMVVLDVDHPDVEEFITCKVREERKARALREAGFDMDLDGADSHSLQYQNANNSVGLSDAFLQAYLDDRDWDLKAVKDGRTIKTLKARALMREIAEAAWECADPGVFYLDTMNRWHTSPAAGPIRATNPCGEYVRPANTSCNLASIRLTKFVQDDGSFDVASFTAAVETTITAMDISVHNAEYPTPKVTAMVNNYRELGIGYTDLGALLMQQGVSYDSDAGRAWAAAITALMSGVAYRRSAEIAGVLGPYPGWTVPGNAEAHLDVIRRHRDAVDGIDTALAPRRIVDAAKLAWDDALELGERYGYRNAQVSLIAPTGTISFLLDADTTGIEPDLALAKTKKLVGGGTMKIVNQGVPKALKQLGYPPRHVADIVDYVTENNTVKGAPHLHEDHYPVFDCAMGDSPIHYMGHVKMLAAVQPFLSGSSSKTVNMPETATVEEIEALYLEGWRLGLKNLAIYRDNCKVGQPLSADKKGGDKKGSDKATPAAAEAPKAAERPSPVRRRLPRKRPSKTTSFRIADCDGYVNAGEYPDTGELGEIFLKVAKQGSTLAGVMDAFAIAISIGLQYGVPLKAYVEKFINMRFEPSGITDDPDFRFATSVVDYIFRRLGADYLSPEDRAALNVFTTTERKRALDGGQPIVTNGHGSHLEGSEAAAPAAPAPPDMPVEGLPRLVVRNPAVDAPLCYTCGISMRPAGSCFVCESCGTTSGCS